MPLIRVTLNPSYRLLNAGKPDTEKCVTRRVIRTDFGRRLPQLFVDNSAQFGLDAGTTKEGVEVRFSEYGRHDINVPDLGVRIEFSEVHTYGRRREIAAAIYTELTKLLAHEDVCGEVPPIFALDVSWGPMHGFLTTRCGNVLSW